MSPLSNDPAVTKLLRAVVQSLGFNYLPEPLKFSVRKLAEQNPSVVASNPLDDVQTLDKRETEQTGTKW